MGHKRSSLSLFYNKIYHTNINMEKKRDFKELRCHGKNKKGRICNTLLYRYLITGDEIVVEIKCPQCNSFNVLHLPFNKYENKNTK